MVRVWRITHRQYAESAFSGEGARLYGGRFNSEGKRAVYTSGSLSLSLLELLVQINDRDYLEKCVQFYADIPGDLIYKPAVNELPAGWDDVPYGKSAQRFGDQWLKDDKHPVLRIPSVVVPVEFNYVINPAHRHFVKIEISPSKKVILDPRIKNSPA
jgi:RES domain-containing protein